jgi:hypothetical protein
MGNNEQVPAQRTRVGQISNQPETTDKPRPHNTNQDIIRQNIHTQHNSKYTMNKQTRSA